MLRIIMLALTTALLTGVTVSAQTPQIETRTIEYREDGVTYRGYLARPQAVAGEQPGERPGVLVVHEWWGLNEYAKQRTRELAELGYVAFAVDMYGEGKTTDDAAQAGKWAGALYTNREKMRDRAEAGLEVLEDLDGVDDDRLAVIGYCFGGTVATELAYEDDDLTGAVSFHGNPMPAMADDDDIEARILVLHGDADPLVSDAELKAFTDSMDRKRVNYRVIRYPDAKHSFTNPDADDLGMDGVGYNAEADEKSWADMKEFLADIFNKR